MENIIKLQSANITQITDESIKGPWIVRENITNDFLHELPNTISDRDMFEILDFAKKYELIAFNLGIEFGKARVNNQPLHDEIAFLKEHVKQLKDHSDKLANLIEEITGE